MVLRDAVPQDLVREARRLINRRIGQEGIEPDRIAYYQQNYWFPEYMQHPHILELWHQSDLRPLTEEAMGATGDISNGMIALRFPYTEEEAARMESSPEPFRWKGHFDGLRAVTADGIDNGVELGVLNSFTALVGVALSDQEETYSGNLGLLRGAHHHGQDFFQMQHRESGRFGPGGAGWPLKPDGNPDRFIPRYVTEQYAAAEGSEQTKDGTVWPVPTQMLMKAGDAVIVHYCTPHGYVSNLSPDTRYMIFFRVQRQGHAAVGGLGTGEALCDIFLEWPGLVQTAQGETERAARL